MYLPATGLSNNALILDKFNFKSEYNKTTTITSTNIFFFNIPISTEKIVFNNKMFINSGNYYYLEYYFTLLLHGYLLKNKNRTFSLYPINHYNFLKGHSFSPSFDNVIKFKRFIFKSKVLNTTVPSLLFQNLTKSHKNKLFLNKFTPVFYSYKNKSLLNVVKFVNLLNLYSVNCKLKHRWWLSRKKYNLLRHFKKLFYKSSKLLKKKERYVKFLIKTKNLTKNRNFKAKIRLKKLSNYNLTYSKNLNLARFTGNNKITSRFLSKNKTPNHANLALVDTKKCFVIPEFNKSLLVLLFFKNSFLLKVLNLSSNLLLNNQSMSLSLFEKIKRMCRSNSNINFNIVPSSTFNFKIKKLLTSNNYNVFLKENLTPWVYSNVLRFIEFCSSKKVLLQLYSFMNQSINLEYITLYKR